MPSSKGGDEVGGLFDDGETEHGEAVVEEDSWAARAMVTGTSGSASPWRMTMGR